MARESQNHLSGEDVENVQGLNDEICSRKSPQLVTEYAISSSEHFREKLECNDSSLRLLRECNSLQMTTKEDCRALAGAFERCVSSNLSMTSSICRHESTDDPGS